MLAFDHCSTRLVKDTFGPYHVDDLMFVQCEEDIEQPRVGNTLASSNTTGWVMMLWSLPSQSNCAT